MSVLRVPSWLTMGVLTLCGMVVSLQQTLVIPLLPELPSILGVSTGDASWLVTATLLTGAVATPIVARTADMYGKRRMLLVALSAMTVGSLVAALGGTFLSMLIGRAMQGFGASLIPVGMSIMRDQLPKEKLAGGIALMSATLGIGSALGLPLSGVLYSAFGWTSLFWSSALAGAVLILTLLLVLDESSQRFPGRFDVPGALVLTIILVSVLLPLSKGASWGWASGQVIGSLALAAVSLAVWIPLQLRTREPMVNLRTAVRRPVLLTNVSSYFVGFAMFLNSLVTTQQLQVPTDTGYGLALPVAVAGLAMVPGGLMMLVLSPVSGRMINRWGGKPTLLTGGAVMGLTYLWRMFNHDAVREVVLGNMAVSMGSAIAFAAMPTLIMASAPRSETASANGLNTLIRSLGTSSSSAVTALVFASLTVTVDGAVFPSGRAMALALLLGVAVCTASVLFTVFVPGRERAGKEDEATGAGASGSARARGSGDEDEKVES
ncbi:MFS transporter [Nocardiopsis kunsanensis]|uniref:MFS transporter n=1 Tax=Nocardiopsis kunsanensis TaxID=141693 RepID=A0A918XB10_9ACTN|nr:MFS transporter [Nocardiopsis kunsanensis]GHD20681.1 MFS transporter [Nocardiopsis kunsanensis]